MSEGALIPRPTRLRVRDGLSRLGPPVVALAVGIAIVVLWRQEVFPTNFVGEAQSPSTTMATSLMLVTLLQSMM